MRSTLYGTAALVVLMGCGGLATSATTEAGGDATRRAIESGSDITVDTTISPLPEASTDVSEATRSEPDATADAPADVNDWDAACLRDGGGKPGQCCASQGDCSPNPAIDQICCDYHVCVVCITKR